MHGGGQGFESPHLHSCIKHGARTGIDEFCNNLTISKAKRRLTARRDAGSNCVKTEEVFKRLDQPTQWEDPAAG